MSITNVVYSELVARATTLEAKNTHLAAALEEALEYFEDRADVVDGDYGEPAPNKEMALVQSLRAALAKVRS